MFQNYNNKPSILTFPISLSVMKLLVISITWQTKTIIVPKQGPEDLLLKNFIF